ncbi:ATP-binding protein [Thermodesulfovibrionales bacterium]|nr:ATP-binding protein [Thermodesulfovibrionales bacterium]MCL0070972.1 ATP-binding protein [Thermodesulfovibrionales bacterium]
MNQIIIKRKLLKELEEHLPKKEISLIIGARQVGKTTLMLLLKECLERKGEKTVFLNLDSEMDKEFFVSQETLIRKIKLEIGKNQGYVFIDEIQRKENAGIFLKGIYDLNLPYKFIVSGSGSMELKERIHESLVGRKRVFELNPISFDEFVNFKTDYRYENKLVNFFDIEKERTENFLNEYLGLSGYPRVVLEEKLSEKTKNIDEIFCSYLEKDISYLLKVQKLDVFSSLIRILASNIGGLINFSELASTLGISVLTVKNYLWYAEKTFVIQRLTPYFKNVRKEVTKSPVIYFYDLGLRNYSLGIFGNIKGMGQGFLFQNFIFNLLKEKFRFSGGSLHFWRTKDKAEVDFIVDFGREVIPIEAKYKKMNKPRVERSMKTFIEKYKPKESWVVNLNFEKEIEIEKTKVKFLPFHRIY